MKNKLKYYISSFLVWKTGRQINVYGVFEDMYNFIKDQEDSKQKYTMLWIIFYQILRYETKIEKNLGYLDKILK